MLKIVKMTADSRCLVMTKKDVVLTGLRLVVQHEEERHKAAVNYTPLRGVVVKCDLLNVLVQMRKTALVTAVRMAVVQQVLRYIIQMAVGLKLELKLYLKTALMMIVILRVLTYHLNSKSALHLEHVLLMNVLHYR